MLLLFDNATESSMCLTMTKQPPYKLTSGSEAFDAQLWDGIA
jgi:hypothetical protein